MGMAAWHFAQLAANAFDTSQGKTSGAGATLGAPAVLCTAIGAPLPACAVGGGLMTGGVTELLPALGRPWFGKIPVPRPACIDSPGVGAADPQAAASKTSAVPIERRAVRFRVSAKNPGSRGWDSLRMIVSLVAHRFSMHKPPRLTEGCGQSTLTVTPASIAAPRANARCQHVTTITYDLRYLELTNECPIGHRG
jgi:hypothetical protein